MQKTCHLVVRVMVVLSFGLFGLIACSDPQEANEENFSAALQEYLSTKPACLDWPDRRTYKMLNNRSRKLDALAEAGLLELHIFKPSKAAGTRRTRYQYILSKKGLTIAGVDDAGMAQRKLGAGEDLKLCYGKREVVDIDTFTPPRAMGPYTVSEVKYTWKLADVQDWVRNKSLESAFKLKKKLKQGPRKDTELLALTNKGWLHMSFLD